MKVFQCDDCGNLLFFENVSCLRCNHPLGFVPELLDLCALESVGQDRWHALAPAAADKLYRRCANASAHEVCNWLVPVDDKNPHCRACRLNLVIPDLRVPGNLGRWQKLEAAKRRVIYSLQRFNLSTEQNGQIPPLRFKFLADPPGGHPILTGHAAGVITINIAEADDAERERRRTQLHEPLRTPLGHIRHEIAHYYWDRLIANSQRLNQFRQVFGDERADYSRCLEKHYQNGPPPDWSANFVSAYASCHPWEDWAETWAHYLHITDSLETAASFGLQLRPRHSEAANMRAEPNKVESDSDFDQVLRHWIPLTHALNELNRGMGLFDLYPFILAGNAARKLRFIHELLR